MISRYENPRIAEIWADEAVYRRWWEVETEHVRTIASNDVAEVLRLAGPPTEEQVRYYERESGHEMLAFLTALDYRIQFAQERDQDDSIAAWGDKARSALHYGLTSSDTQDTALALGILDSRKVVVELASQVLFALVDQINTGEGRTAIGRTHGQLAAPMPERHRWEVLYAIVSRCHTRASEAALNMKVGKMSGPVGVLAQDDETNTLERLGLYSTTSSQLVPRDRLANWAYQMGALVTACEAVATQVWLLAQEGIAGVRLNNTVSSSAMPHKRNPVMAENIRGLARMARGLAQQLQLGVIQWGEHDLAHSSVERVAVPDLLHLTCTALQRTAALVSGLVVVDTTPPEGYLDTSAILRQAQAEGMAYVDSHKAIRTGRLTRVVRSTDVTATNEEC